MARRQARLISSSALREAMTERRASYRTLARWAGCSQTMIGFLAKGDLATCTPKLADRIEHALGVPEASLFLPPSSSVQLDEMMLDGETQP